MLDSRAQDWKQLFFPSSLTQINYLLFFTFTCKNFVFVLIGSKIKTIQQPQGKILRFFFIVDDMFILVVQHKHEICVKSWDLVMSHLIW